MSQSGVSVADECVSTYNDLKLTKKYKYIVYKLSDDYRQIVVENASADQEWDSFRNKLIEATTTSKTGKVGPCPRYAVYDFEYDSGEGTRNKIAFVAWSPDEAGVQPKMVYASSKDALRRSLDGVIIELQANDPDELLWDNMIKNVSKGRGK